jgi:diguanylate cyclase (GGDEF)-like protein
LAKEQVMKLRNKVLIIISLAWVIFLGLTYIGSKQFLMSSFLTLEHDRADADLGRIDQSLEQINNSLYTFTSDWSHWNDLYDYMKGTNPAFVPNNLNMSAFVNSNINMMSFWNNELKVVVGSGVDTDKQMIVAYPHGVEKYIFPGSTIFDRKDVNKDLSGYILTKNGIMLVAACAITDGDKLLPPLGIMITARNLNKALIEKIIETTKTNVTLLLPDRINNDAYLKNIFDTLNTDKSGHYSEASSEEALSGYTLIKDIFDKPIGMFRMITPRAIYATGQKAIKYYLISFVALGILFSLLMLWLLRVLIIKRLERLDREVAYISDKQAIKQRVDASGNDELTSVSVEINHMLDIIQASQEQLEHRVVERTEELQQTNVKLQDEITERKSVEKELNVHKEHLIRLAHYDSLTALPNRVFFNEILNKSISSSSREKKQLAILFIDLDRFKNINDALGHTIGDMVLREMSNRFLKIVSNDDTLARLGGDEFIILLSDIQNNEAVSSVAQKIIEAAAKPVQLQGHEFFISASVGVSIYPNDGESLEALQKNADMAMYKSKHSGGGVFNFYTPEMDTAANEHMKMEAALRRAIQNNEFVLYFQPQMNLKDGKVKHLEALIRWIDPEVGLISPVSFIPLAEETGLIMPIGEWALHEACRINKKWQNAGYDPVSVAVNISPKQFRHQDVAQIVKDALDSNKLNAKYLEVEITETAVMENVDDAIAKLNIIREMGVHISVDDFGTGYTSINYLRQYPISVLKIDQTFVKGLPDNQNDAAITSAVIALGHNLGLQIVAEGVETAEQMQYLFDHGCDLIQGYFLSRPLPEEKIIEQFTRNGETVTTELITS